MKIKNIFLAAIFLLCCNRLSAQVSCGWKKTTEQQLSHPVSPAGLRFQNYLRPQQTMDADSIYTLPVVVHVIHTGTAIGAPDNPTDASIIAMISNLNNAWRKNGASFGGVDMKIQFQLATRSPSCGSTNGINRVNGSSVPNYASGGITNYNAPGSAPETAVKRLSRWSNTDYINIWIVNKINGDSIYTGGYAYFPEYNSAITDGLVLNASVVDGSNKTIVHEMGHYFYLYHSFEDGNDETTCAANTDCTSQGDLICDTEPCLLLYDCASTTNSCTGNPYIVTDVTHNYSVQNNYMGYTNCQWMFTQGQKTRARAALFAFRNGLISSAALNTTAPASSPAVACIPTALYGLSPYFGVGQVDFNTLHVYSNTSDADSSFYFDRTCNQSTSVEKGKTYTLTVTGTYFNTQRIKVFIDYNNDGDFNDFGEAVLNDLQGVASGPVIIPTDLVVGARLRMRVLSDNPNLPDPSSCQLSGDATDGAGQIEDYTIVILPKKIYSINSGPWNVPATWSCNCVPQDDDEVTIKAPHSITVTAAMGAVQCGKLILENGSHFDAAGTAFKLVGKY
ncbi:MAG: M43 family zinc metalloprotease [Ferruginibacter sp.]